MSIEEINEMKKKTYQEYLSHKLDLYFNGTGEEHIADFFNSIFFVRHIGDFHDGIARVTIGKEYGYYFINTKGDRINNEEYDKAWDFRDGFAKVKQNGKYHYINIKGEKISDEKYGDEKYGDDNFHDGCALVLQNDKYYYINTKGERINEEEYDDAWNFYDGCARVLQNGKYHYINIKGEKISEEYDDAWYFYDGLAKVKQNGKYHYINTEGRKINDEKYDEAADFHDGCARVLQNGMFFYININGKRINDEEYDYACDFSHGVAKVNRKGKWYYINMRGKSFSDERKARESNDEYANVYTILSNIRKEDVKKSLLGYRYQELNLKYQPVFDYGRYILCQKNEITYFLYDRYSKKYNEFNYISKIGYDSHFVYIKDRHDDVSLYLMQKDCMIDVTYYIAKILLMRKNSIDENVEILGFDEFCDEYRDLFSKEIEKRRETEKRKEKTRRKKGENEIKNRGK